MPPLLPWDLIESFFSSSLIISGQRILEKDTFHISHHAKELVCSMRDQMVLNSQPSFDGLVVSPIKTPWWEGNDEVGTRRPMVAPPT